MTSPKKRIVRSKRSSSSSKNKKTLTFILISFGLGLLAIGWQVLKEKVPEEPITDQNGDPVTEPYVAEYPIQTQRQPMPPQRQKHFEDKPEFDKAPAQTERYPYLLEMPEAKGNKIDWNDYKAMAEDAIREGPGEQGQATYISDESFRELEQELSMENGFNALLSDVISVNRSLPDVRKKGCLSMKYLEALPSTSVIIPFYNEYFSVLRRTLHSIVNRTPPELLQEIIIVDDYSDREYLKDNLDTYVEETFDGLVRVIRLPNRTGLIGARLAGAREAVGEVLVFFDSHIECNYNWLPPLLEPIALNPNISTCPIVDVIKHDTFEYFDDGLLGRGAFNWNLLYKQLELRPGDTDEEAIRPFHNPIMMGGLFAISQDFFWTLGGYDEGLDIWGAEQYELSLKIWMCGGMLLDVPCSRVGHVFRGPMTGRPSPRNYDFVARNYKRVAEVWLDDYKNAVYQLKPHMYEGVDPGDLSQQHALRESLQCKPFQWFLDVVAPDLVERFPPWSPPHYATGVIQSMGFPLFCVDTMNHVKNEPVGMYYCADNKTHPQDNQRWAYTQRNEIKLEHEDLCWDVSDPGRNARIEMWACHGSQGNQKWFYDTAKQWLLHGGQLRCLEAVQGENGEMDVVVNVCDNSNENMRWTFGYINETMIANVKVNIDDV